MGAGAVGGVGAGAHEAMEWASWLPKRFTPSRNRACSTLDQNLRAAALTSQRAANLGKREGGWAPHLARATFRCGGVPLPDAVSPMRAPSSGRVASLDGQRAGCVWLLLMARVFQRTAAASENTRACVVCGRGLCIRTFTNGMGSLDVS
jgi:hypothetical protein